MTNSNDSIWNRTRDLKACNAVSPRTSSHCRSTPIMDPIRTLVIRVSTCYVSCMPYKHRLCWVRISTYVRQSKCIVEPKTVKIAQQQTPILPTISSVWVRYSQLPYFTHSVLYCRVRTQVLPTISSVWVRYSQLPYITHSVLSCRVRTQVLPSPCRRHSCSQRVVFRVPPALYNLRQSLGTELHRTVTLPQHTTC